MSVVLENDGEGGKKRWRIAPEQRVCAVNGKQTTEWIGKMGEVEMIEEKGWKSDKCEIH